LFPITAQNSRKHRQAKPLLHLLCVLLLLHRACQVHSTITHTVARQAYRAGLKGRGAGAIFTGGPLWRNSWRHRL